MQNETTTSNSLDLTEVATTESAVAADSVPSVNLTKAREAKRLSVGDAAYALKVSPRVIEAIEANDWSNLPGRAFIVGMLRAYGRLLEIGVDTLVDMVPGTSPNVKKTVVPNKVQRAAKPASRRDGETKRQTHRMLKTGLVMMLAAILLAYVVPGEWLDNTVQQAQSLYEHLSNSQSSSQPVSNDQSAVPAASGDQTAPVTTTEAQVPTGAGTLELRFAAPAWVEVRDYSGRIIYSQLNAAGTTQFITGAAPLDIMVGNAKQVQARWRDEPIKLDKLSGDDVARQILR